MDVPSLKPSDTNAEWAEVVTPRQLVPGTPAFMRQRIQELEAALRPFANAYRHAASQPEWLREDMLASMTICGITTDDFVRAADACKTDN